MVRFSDLSQGYLLAVLGITAFVPTAVQADCVSLVKGAVAMDVMSCGYLNPEKSFDLSENKYHFIRDLPAANRKSFYDAYRGLIIKGRVVKSEAVRSGLSPEKGALNGDNITVFVPPGSSSCEAAMGKRVAGIIDEACCEGGGDAPCLLSTAYVFKDLKPLTAAATAVTEKKKRIVNKSKEYKEAEVAFEKKDFKKAVKFFEAAREKKELDINGSYKLGLAYRVLDQCRKAVPVLRDVVDRIPKNDFWADEEDDIRRSQLLLARCYAKLNEPGYAVIILNAYLLDPKKYKTELSQSLKHKDFGWIHTSKEYKEYERDARKALNNLR